MANIKLSTNCHFEVTKMTQGSMTIRKHNHVSFVNEDCNYPAIVMIVRQGTLMNCNKLFQVNDELACCQISFQVSYIIHLF